MFWAGGMINPHDLAIAVTFSESQYVYEDVEAYVEQLKEIITEIVDPHS